MTHSLLTSRSLYTAAQVRELEQRAIHGYGIASYDLMCRAGEAAWNVLRECWPEVRQIAVVCGTGNNGGDGLVVARLAALAGYHPKVWVVGDVASLRGNAALAWHALQTTPAQIASSITDALQGAELIVDAIFGTGLDRVVEGDELPLIAKINASGLPVLALDIPSGLSADRGVPLGSAVAASATITFAGRKRGLFTGMARDYVGEMHYADLQIPAEQHAGMDSDCMLFGLRDVDARLPRRRRAAHKGEHGHVLAMGGAPGMSGAVRLAAEAALRSGAGYVSVATHTAHAALFNITRPELMCQGVHRRADIAPYLQRASVIAIGPGLGRDTWAQMMWGTALDAALPMVIDADALALLASAPQTRSDWVLTPHPGEAGNLLGCNTHQIEEDRFAAVRALQTRYGGIVVLKGAGTLVCDGAHIAVIETGNPGMASGGMGDVLTGVIAALIAQGLHLYEAACVGACVHGAAGDAAAAQGERGLIASDVLSLLRAYVNPNVAQAAVKGLGLADSAV